LQLYFVRLIELKVMNKQNAILKSFITGAIAGLILLAFYFIVLNFVSGWEYTLKQFDDNWYYIMLLSLGFGIQVGLFVFLKEIVRNKTDQSGKIIAISGTTSTAAMIACCSHYLVNILPVIGVTGMVAFAAQFQTELFWVGIISNTLGIIYILRRVIKATKGGEEN